MAKCGLKPYDNLPARVGWIDVDAARYELGEVMKKVELIKQRLDKAIYLHTQKVNNHTLKVNNNKKKINNNKKKNAKRM